MTPAPKNNKFWLLILLALVSGGFVTACVDSTVPAGGSSVDRGSFEHRYATERLKQEGYSTSEAQQAADAIIKFHNAQQNRKR